jgi:hypothetical protein
MFQGHPKQKFSMIPFQQKLRYGGIVSIISAMQEASVELWFRLAWAKTQDPS